MPVTYHFKPFPKPGEAHFEISQKRPSLSTNPCACENEKSRCQTCQRDDNSLLRQPSQALLSPIKEHPEQTRRDFTPKARRDRRRASSRASVASAFESAVGSDDYFTLFPSVRSKAFARSESGSPTRSRSRRQSSMAGSASASRSASSEQTSSPLAEAVESSSVKEGDEEAKGEEVVRRGS